MSSGIGFLSGGDVSRNNDTFASHYTSSINSLFGFPVYTTDDRKLRQILISRNTYGETFAVHNPKRHGKSLTVTFIVIERMKRERNVKLVANNPYNLKFIMRQKDFIFMNDPEVITDLKGNCILYIDELRRYVDGRLAMSQKSRFISNLLADTGKNKLDFYYTDQDSAAVDKRVRINVDYVLAPYFDHTNDWCRVLVFDKIEKYEFFKMGWGKYNPPIFEFAFWAKPYYKFYDTEYKIDDYHMQFKVKKHATMFARWCEEKDLEPDKRTLSLYSSTQGLIYSGDEEKAMIVFLEDVEAKDWDKWE